MDTSNNNVLTVTPAAPMPAGGGAMHYQFMDDGSVNQVQNGPVVFPPVPPTITPVLPAGSIPASVLTAIKGKVQKTLEKLS
jgi:hypothetical protein